MRLKKLYAFKSRNIRMFFWVAVGLVTLMLLFFVLNKNPLTPKVYIAFSFIWLAPIISVCLTYMAKGGDRRRKKLFNIVAGIYLPLTFAANTLLVRLISLYTLIAVDFFLTFGILMIGMMFYYFGNDKDM